MSAANVQAKFHQCLKCRQRRVASVMERYKTAIEHDGRSYEIDIADLTFNRCENCKNTVLPDDADDRISVELRKAIGLMAPEDIKRNRLLLQLTQKQMAEILGIAEATLCRWETGAQLLKRHSDLILRAFFELPEFRSYLARRLQLPMPGLTSAAS